jgi:uncharacterized protein (DUF427 family)
LPIGKKSAMAMKKEQIAITITHPFCTYKIGEASYYGLTA